MKAEILYLLLHFLDYQQTSYIVRHPESYHETNIFLGHHPSQEKVNNYFLITGLGHGLLTFSLPEKYRKIWLTTTITIESSYVLNNLRIGIPF